MVLSNIDALNLSQLCKPSSFTAGVAASNAVALSRLWGGASLNVEGVVCCIVRMFGGN